MTDAQKRQSVILSLVAQIGNEARKSTPDWTVIYALDQALEAVQAASTGA